MIYDVAIIGGGLAGCSAGLRLARAGLDVILFEAGTYPHHKVCGEFMSPGCREQFAQLGIDRAIEQRGAVAIDQFLISTPESVTWQGTLPGAGVGISRYYIDQLLADHNQAHGVDLRLKTKVVNVAGDLHSGFTLHTRQRETIQARTVIGAYGKRSQIDQRLARPFLKQRQPFIGLKHHVSNVPIPNRVELHTFAGGYCGMSEIEDGRTNVCLLVREDIFRQHGQGDIATFIAWMTAQNPLIAERLAPAEYLWDKWLSVAQVPFHNKSLVQNDVLMVGDAAGMITPLTGDGMEIALQSGDIAATQLLAYFQRGASPQMLIDAYRQAWQSAFKGRIRIGRMSQFFMLRPAWLQWALRGFRTVPPVGDFFVKQTRHVS